MALVPCFGVSAGIVSDERRSIKSACTHTKLYTCAYSQDHTFFTPTANVFVDDPYLVLADRRGEFVAAAEIPDAPCTSGQQDLPLRIFSVPVGEKDRRGEFSVMLSNGVDRDRA